MTDLSIAYAQVGRYADAIRLQEETLALKEAKLGPNHHFTLWSMNLLARFLVTAPDAKLRDPPRALELAKKAAESLPKAFNSWGTYGIVLYRVDDWEGAIEALEKAISLSKPDDPANAAEGFFLAMAHWQLALRTSWQLVTTAPAGATDPKSFPPVDLRGTRGSDVALVHLYPDRRYRRPL
jgi:tetratricopeptide (TPR) repeat protein